MAETYKIEDGHKYRLVSVPAPPTMIAYMARAGYGDNFHDEHNNPNEIWEPCND